MMLGRERDIHIVGMAESAEEGLDLIEKVRPTVAVIDYSLPRMSGTEMCEVLARRHPEIPVIMLTSYLEDPVIRGSLQAGARAFVFKDVESHELRRAIRAVAQGQSVLDPKVAGRVIGWAHKAARKKPPPEIPSLSKREVEVMRLIARGLSDQEIADALGLSRNTVKTYVRRILFKLECRSRSEAVAVASRWQIL